MLSDVVVALHDDAVGCGHVFSVEMPCGCHQLPKGKAIARDVLIASAMGPWLKHGMVLSLVGM